MKRLLIFAALIVAIGSIGGNMIAHAQTAQSLTPEQTAALQQQLDVAKATLANLQMQAGAIPPADAGTPSTVPPSIEGTGAQATVTPAASGVLTADQISAFQATLNTLASALMQLNTSLAANSTLTPSQETAVQNTLNGMQNTLVAMANTISSANGMSNAASVATGQGSSPVAANSPSTATSPSAVTAQVGTPETTPSIQTSANTVPQTAQASSLWSFTKSHWPTIVIVLLVIAILAILFWPEKETVRTVPTTTSGSGKPKSAPTTNVTVSQPQNIVSNPPRPMNNNHSVPSPATPVANAVAAPSQK